MAWRCVLLLFAISLAACRTNEAPDQQVKDAEITASVKAKLAQEMGVATIGNISVNATNGIVTLSGQVDTAENKARAASIAQGVANVARVVNNLQVAAKPAT